MLDTCGFKGRSQYTRWLRDIQYETRLFRLNWEKQARFYHEPTRFSSWRDVKIGHRHRKSRQNFHFAPYSRGVHNCLENVQTR
ncbi:hypothetical protein EB837_08550 [Kluyvera ascorbata]|uniref:Uncharacterized protein n=1 Tax=Kluyvera ascorbata TaxID=51288 RepID=A0A3N2S855_9ENTR|nr:hypothetical protein EB837_08550 [Kluyvera ascorbata]